MNQYIEQIKAFYEQLDDTKRRNLWLALAGTDKTRLLQAQVWLKDIARDGDGMNAAWAEWVGPPSRKPVRATVQSKLAKPAMLVEIQVVAAR